ncbi:MAG TPA: UvrD-helicase domain-containing protein, partial [Gammaproteobacteria bacterium]|nr:UvrD-helicase domain-containing protein [Gammaproteobacteria bacterium]
MVAEAAAVDERARTTALDPRRSFIVQAPAGSGKTELLIRRYLTLLATVEEPEQIIAITFTRKAAAEMRQRVAAALRAAAAHGTPARVSESLCTGSIRVRCGANADPKAGARTADSSAPPSPHAAETLGLARAVLARDAERDWKLLDYPQRMRIETLDALNAWLARRLPVMASGVGGAGVVEDAEALYREAARRTLGELEGQGEIAASLRTLLGHCDNDVMRLESLLAELLPRREQWLPYFAGAEEAELRRLLEAALRRLVDEELASAEALLSDRLRAALEPLLKHAAQHAADGHREAFAAFRERPFFEGADRLAAWQGVAHLLLTRQDG